MPRNGNGEYDLPAGNPVVPGTVIESTWANNTLNDLASALTDSLTADGQTTPVSNLPMGGYHHTGVSDPTLRNQYATLGMSQDGRNTRVNVTGGVDNLVGTLVGQASTYVAGAIVSLFAPANNTGPMTLNYNAIGARSLLAPDGAALGAGAIAAGAYILATYTGSAFVMLSAVASGAGTALLQASVTGWERPASGVYPSITVAGPTSVNIPAGSAWIMPPGQDGDANAVAVSWLAQTVTLTFVSSAFSTTLGVNSAGAIVQYSGRVSTSTCRGVVLIGAVEHLTGVANAAITRPAIFGDDGYTGSDASYILSNQLVAGGEVTANGVSPLQMDITAGQIFSPGASSSTVDGPNALMLGGQTSLLFRTLADQNVLGTPTVTAPVANYDPNGAGVVTPLPANGDCTIHRLYYLYGQYIWMYGQFVYSSVDQALTRLVVDRSKINTSPFLSDATLIAEIIATKTCTGLNTANAAIISFGGTNFNIGAAGGIGEAPINGLAYGRQDAGWVQVVKTASPQFTGTSTLTGTAPKYSTVLSPVTAGYSGLNAKQLGFDWCNIEVTHPDDKTYFRSYNPANGTLRNTATWDLASGSWEFGGSGNIRLPNGTTAQRPASPTTGMIRYNTDTPGYEGYSGGLWGALGGGAVLGAFYENSQVIASNYTITAGKNAMSAGPITINTGVTVTVPTGSTWSVV